MTVPISLKQQFLREQEKQLALTLPPDLEGPWLTARASRLAVAAASPLARRLGWRAPKPIGLWSPGTATMVLSATLRFLDAGLALTPPIRTFLELLEPPIVDKLLAGPFHGLAGPTRALTLGQAGTFAARVLHVDGSDLFRAARRILRDEPRTDRSALLREYCSYRDGALGLDPAMEPGEQHGLDTVVWSRRAATAVIAVEAAPRQTELTGLARKDIVVDGSRALVIIPGHLSKTRTIQVRDLSEEGSKVVIEYVLRAREFLAALSPAQACDALWLTHTGTELCPEGVLAALRRDLAQRMGVPVTCNLLRRAMASRTDIVEAEAGDYLGHANRDRTSNDVYAQFDYREALSDIVEIWDALDGMG